MAVNNSGTNHIAISVPDAERAVDWYTAVLGLQVAVPLSQMKAKYALGGVLTKVYGDDLEELKLALLSSGDGVGFEVFEFVRPRYRGPETRLTFSSDDYTRAGFFHICWTTPDPEKAAAIGVEKGGKIIGEPIHLADVETSVYLQDPWGILWSL